MNACDVDLLSQYLDGGLMLPQRVALEQHMLICSACTYEVARLRLHENALLNFGSVRMPLPPSTEARIARSIDTRGRRSPLLSLGRMMPAAVGSSIAALLVLVSVNLGFQYGGQIGGAESNRAPIASHVIVQQSATLIKSRRTSALMGGYAAVRPQFTPQMIRRIQLDLN